MGIPVATPSHPPSLSQKAPIIIENLKVQVYTAFTHNCRYKTLESKKSACWLFDNKEKGDGQTRWFSFAILPTSIKFSDARIKSPYHSLRFPKPIRPTALEIIIEGPIKSNLFPREIQGLVSQSCAQKEKGSSCLTIKSTHNSSQHRFERNKREDCQIRTEEVRQTDNEIKQVTHIYFIHRLQFP